MMRVFKYLLAPLALLSAVACSDPLQVDNPNNPERERLFARPADAENLAGSLYQQIHSATMGVGANATTNLRPSLLTASFENASALANNGLGPRSALPRAPIVNVLGNPYATENLNDFNQLQRTAKTASDILRRLEEPDFDLGTDARKLRMKAFTLFAHGVALGTVAQIYDSAAAPVPADPTDETFVPELLGAHAVMAIALQQLDAAVTIAASAEARASGGFPLPDNWLRGNPLTADDFIRFVRSYKARLRAAVARTPEERAAVDWAAVVDDAANGIAADFLINMDPSTGWTIGWLQTTLHYRDANWHQMTPYIIGMADTSGAYAAWLNVNRDQRAPFLIRTPDLRFPSGDTRALQNEAGGGGQAAPAAGSRRYFRNRAPGGDQTGLGWANSQYDHYRFRAFADAQRIGRFPIMTKAEIDLLRAEGLLRLGGGAEAAALIDLTRTTAGLPSLAAAGAVTADAIVPGGAACVPQVPQRVTPAVVSCGTVWEAMKWEKRMETAYTHYGAWFFDSRAWGDLPIGTPLEWPVPFQEMDARLRPSYNLGGVGGRSGAGESTYGFGSLDLTGR
jgi:hypothetical protein